MLKTKIGLRKKALAAFLFLSFMLSASIETSAQGGVFQRGPDDRTIKEQVGLLVGNREVQENNGTITNQTFETPIGSDTLLFLIASLGYFVMKKKEE